MAIRIRWTTVAAVTLAVMLVGVSRPAAAAAAPLRYDSVFGFKGPAGLYAYGVEFDETSNTILVSDYWNYRVKRFNKDTGALLKTFARASARPTTSRSTQAGHVWVAYQEQSTVAEYTQGGSLIRKIGPGGNPSYASGCGGGKTDIPTHILAHPTGLLYVSDPRCRNIYCYDESTGQFKFVGRSRQLGLRHRHPAGDRP